MTRLHSLKGLPNHILQQIKNQLEAQPKRNLSGEQEESKRNKYNATKTEQDSITFDSQKELKRYNELKLLEKSGQIQELQVHPKFVLQEAFQKHGIVHRMITYYADFMYVENGICVVEDVKAYDKKKQEYLLTDVFKIKRKLFEKKYPHLTIRITGEG